MSALYGDTWPQPCIPSSAVTRTNPTLGVEKVSRLLIFTRRLHETKEKGGRRACYRVGRIFANLRDNSARGRGIMSNHLKFYINGAWADPATPRTLDVINPATEEPFTAISIGSAADVDRAVAAARAAFPKFSQTSKAERVALLKRIIECYRARMEDIAQAVSAEMGAPITMARDSQAAAGLAHLQSTLRALEGLECEEGRGTTRIVREGIGVAGLITPWNWPLNQIACKVAPAIAAGCTMILKPSEVAPITGIIFSEVMHAAGVPAGVYNMVNGDGASVGAVMSAHPGIDMMSFTGSTRAGILVAKAAADTVKRVSQELGGKSPNIILRGADLAWSVSKGVQSCFNNRSEERRVGEGGTARKQ